jgi:hypothetical protein
MRRGSAVVACIFGVMPVLSGAQSKSPVTPPCHRFLFEASTTTSVEVARTSLAGFEKAGCKSALDAAFPLKVVSGTDMSAEALTLLLYLQTRFRVIGQSTTITPSPFPSYPVIIPYQPGGGGNGTAYHSPYILGFEIPTPSSNGTIAIPASKGERTITIQIPEQYLMKELGKSEFKAQTQK